MDRFLEGGVCEACWYALPLHEDPHCSRCNEMLPGIPSQADAPICGRCLLDPPEFDALLAAAPYAGSAREILLAFKFHGADYLAERLAAIMVERLPAPAPPVDEIVCVPATSRARRARGYHPAEALAGALSRRLHVPFARRRLEKRRETEVQSRLALSRRPANVRGAFRVAGRPGKSVLLVDDVATSGATARECTRRLRDSGAAAVSVWCFARASRADLPGDPA